jgi:hypothetical protein
MCSLEDRFCGLVVRVLDCRSRGPRFDSLALQKKVGVWNGVHSASWVQLRSCLIEKLRLLSRKPRIRHRDPSRWPRGTLYPQKLAITSPTSGCRSVGIVRSRAQTMEFSLVLVLTGTNSVQTSKSIMGSAQKSSLRDCELCLHGGYRMISLMPYYQEILYNLKGFSLQSPSSNLYSTVTFPTVTSQRLSLSV